MPENQELILLVGQLTAEVKGLNRSVQALEQSLSTVETDLRGLISLRDKGKGILSALVFVSGLIGFAISEFWHIVSLR